MPCSGFFKCLQGFTKEPSEEYKCRDILSPPQPKETVETQSYENRAGNGGTSEGIGGISSESLAIDSPGHPPLTHCQIGHDQYGSSRYADPNGGTFRSGMGE